MQTDLGNGRAVQQGLSQAPVELADSVEGILVEVCRLLEHSCEVGAFWSLCQLKSDTD